MLPGIIEGLQKLKLIFITSGASLRRQRPAPANELIWAACGNRLFLSCGNASVGGYCSRLIFNMSKKLFALSLLSLTTVLYSQEANHLFRIRPVTGWCYA